MLSETIFAMASAKGKAGVSIFRISGPKTLQVLQDIIKAPCDNMEPRKMYLRKLYTTKKSEIIDEALVVYFKDTHSFTGETLAELHTHGSVAVINKLMATLLSHMHLRLAEPGEFARRAFINGKMDLTSAEGLADLIDAETDMQHKQAIAQMGGALAKLYDKWKGELTHIMGLVEACIDFPDEDIPESVLNEVSTKLMELKQNLQNHLNDNRRGERLRSGIKLAIIGSPNVGKSSLINFLTQREIAIVSDIAGTTRDVIEGHIDIGGYPIILQDTAGIRMIDENVDIIEQEGMKRAQKIAKESDIKIIIFDATLQQEQIINTLNQHNLKGYIDENTIILLNKIDLLERKIELDFLPKNIQYNAILYTSIKKQEGLNNLMKQIENIAANIAQPGNTAQITRARHRSDITKALGFLEDFSFNKDVVLAAEDLRMAIRSLSYVTGKITIEEVLGDIFSTFCIGK